MRCKHCENEADAQDGYCVDHFYIFCTCCGDPMTQRENQVRDEVPYPFDLGYGMCKKCGGDPDAVDYRKRLGWAMCTFFDARVPIIRKALSEENRPKWDALPYPKKVRFITTQIEKGRMI